MAPARLTMAAGKLIAGLERRPARSIRVVAFANEEQGLHGGKAYAAAHAADVVRHQLVAESDFGAGRIYAFNTGAPAHADAAEAQIAELLAPLGIERSDKGGPGPDVGPIAAQGAAWAWLGQDGSDYFDYHHTPDDTLDKIDPAALAQNTAAGGHVLPRGEAEGVFGARQGALTALRRRPPAVAAAAGLSVTAPRATAPRSPRTR